MNRKLRYIMLFLIFLFATAALLIIDEKCYNISGQGGELAYYVENSIFQ